MKREQAIRSPGPSKTKVEEPYEGLLIRMSMCTKNMLGQLSYVDKRAYGIGRKSELGQLSFGDRRVNDCRMIEPLLDSIFS